MACGDDDGCGGERRDEQHFGHALRAQGQRDHDRGANSPGYDDNGHGDDGGGGGAVRENNEHGYLKDRPSLQ
jgi:hypothetical protein